jgi:hypothetical protein
MAKYYNLKGFQMNLQVTRYSTILVKNGIHEYPDEIAIKYPSIFEKVIEKELVSECVSYDEMSYKELKLAIKEANIIIDGRKTKKKMISALVNRK